LLRERVLNDTSRCFSHNTAAPVFLGENVTQICAMRMWSKIDHSNEPSIGLLRDDVRKRRTVCALFNAKRNELLCCFNRLMRQPDEIARDERILCISIEYDRRIFLTR